MEERGICGRAVKNQILAVTYLTEPIHIYGIVYCLKQQKKEVGP